MFDIFNMSNVISNKYDYGTICETKGNFTKKNIRSTWWDSTVDVITSLKDAIGSLDLFLVICVNQNQIKNSMTRLFLCKC